MNANPSQPPIAGDDFHRLGIRINEARPRIIRQAATRQAELLSQQFAGVHSPTFQVELATLCVTIYTVLDPRRRLSATERAMLSQTDVIPLIEPQWVHPKSRSQQGPRNRNGFGAIPYESLSTGESIFPNPDAVPPTQWQLLLERWVIYARQRVVWAALFLALLVGMLLAKQLHSIQTATVAPPTENVARPPNIPSPANATTDTPADASSSSSSPAIAANEHNPEVEPAREREPESGIMQASEPMVEPAMPVEPLTEIPAEPLAEVPDWIAQWQPAFEELLLPRGELTPPAGLSAPEQPSAETDSPAMERVASGDDGNEVPLPNETMPVPSETVLAEPERSETADTPKTLPMDDADAAQALDEPPRRPAAMPSKAERNVARQSLLAQLETFPNPATDRGRSRAIDAVLALRETAPAGSADAWVMAEWAAEQSIFLGQFDNAWQHIEALRSEYESSAATVILAITEQAAADADNLVKQRRLAQWALLRSEVAMQSEQFEEATELVRAVLPAQGELSDADLKARLAQRRDAIVIMNRMAESTRAILTAHTLDDVSANDSTVVGRYRCLMLRDWQAGLAWLAQGSDPRLAQAASREIMWRSGDARSVDEAQQIATIWLETGERLRGRMSDSARQHGYNLLREAATTATGLAELELKKRLEKLEADFPEWLTKPSAAPVSTTSLPPPNNDQPQPPESIIGMLGRLKVDGRDLGVAIRYEPGTAITQPVINQIFQTLKQPVPASFELEFAGTLTLQAPTTVRLIATGPPPTQGQQSVRVNGGLQTLRPAVRGASIAIDLPAGPHQVEWQLSANSLEQSFLIVQDEETGQRLPLTAAALANPLASPVQFNLIRNR